LRTVVGSSPSRYSIASLFEPKPVHSAKPAWRMPPISTEKLKPR
jgi:hypothetical protein